MFKISIFFITFVASKITIDKMINNENKLYVALNWSDGDVLKYPSFRVFKSKNGGAYQSISTIDLQRGDVVNVLNVYPVTGKTTNYYDSDGILIQNLTDQSAGLKVFMEGGYNGTSFETAEHFEAYGQVKVSETKKQLIKVTPKSFLEFHQNYKMIWDYDVVMFGSWDAYTTLTGNKPVAAEVLEVGKYLDAGYGVLFGHDSVLPNDKKTGFYNLSSRLHIKIGGGVDIPMNFLYFSTHVQMVRKGTLSQYPWILNDTMTVPLAHTTSQFVTNEEDVWFKFINSTEYPDGHTKLVEAMSNGYATFYLTSNSNVAMIQTGHSCGISYSDERKILANTLFYLKQRSTNMHVNDFNVIDEKNPDAPIEVSKKITADAQRHIKLSLKLKGKDNGDKYDYVIKGYDNDLGEAFVSDITSISIISGLKHFAYSFDDKPTTTVDKLVNKATVVAIGGNSGAAKAIKGDFNSTTSGSNQNVVNGIVEGEGTIEIQNIEQFKPTGTTSNIFRMYLHAVCVDNMDLVSEITDIAIDIDITIPVETPTMAATENTATENRKDGGELNTGNSGKKDNTGTIIGAVVGVVAGLAGAAAATAFLVNACKPPIPIVPYIGGEEEEEEEDYDEELDFDLVGDNQANESGMEYYNVIQNDDEVDPYENHF